MLFIRIEPSSGVPIYRQMMDQIRLQVATGVLAEGRQMPSVRGLARQLAVNQNTVLKVYNELCHDGVLTVERGSGTFVAADARTRGAADVRDAAAAAMCEAVVLGVQSGLGAAELHEILDRELGAVMAERQDVAQASAQNGGRFDGAECAAPLQEEAPWLVEP